MVARTALPPACPACQPLATSPCDAWNGCSVGNPGGSTASCQEVEEVTAVHGQSRLLRWSTLPGSLPDQAMRWNEIQVPPPPTKAPSASSASVWRPSASLAQNTGGRSAKASKPHVPNT